MSTNAREHGHAERSGLAAALAVNAGFFVVELVAGFAAGSLALLADAGHMLSDVAALALALVAAWFATRPPTPDKSYGFYRAEILAALVNGLALVAIAVWVAVEAVRRLGEPRDVSALVVVVVGAAGLAVNLWAARRLAHGHGLNARAARLHMLLDAAGSAAALSAGLLVAAGLRSADAVVGGLLALLIASGAWRVVREAADVLLEATPRHISLYDVRDAILEHPDVMSVHDLHVWTLTSGYVALSAHVVARDAARAQSVLVPIRELVYHRFGVGHATLQVETPGLADEPVHCVDDPRCLP